MSKAIFMAKRNRKGNLVVEIKLPDKKPMNLPRAGRGSDELLLRYNGKEVEVHFDDRHNIVLVEAGNDVLFQKEGVAPRASSRSPAVNAVPARPATQQTTRPANRSAPQFNQGRQANENGSNLQSVSQKRARHALEAVQSWLDKDASAQKELKSYVTSMPAMILMSGFGQTCAFYKSKGGNHALVLGALQSWLNRGDLMAFITQGSAQDYQIAQAESLEYLNWLKKFAKAYLEGEEGE